VNGDAHSFAWFQLSEPQLALPSGHATIAFSMASVLSSRIDNIYASIGLYAIATSTAAARVYKDKHWLSDVMLGSAIGIASGLYVCNLEEERTNPNKNQSFRWQLSPSLNGVNLTLQW
jgi:membrane-associated phospholipid phosphatase